MNHLRKGSREDILSKLIACEEGARGQAEGDPGGEHEGLRRLSWVKERNTLKEKRYHER